MLVAVDYARPTPMVLLTALVVKLGFGPFTESSHEPLPTA